MLPRLVLRVRKAVRRLKARGDESDTSGAQNQARWRAMLSKIEERDRAIEHRLAEAEKALNKLNLN